MPDLRLGITTPDGVADSFLALPDGEPRAGVLFLIDAFGLREQIELMARRIAGEGYAVLAPNLFYRAGPAPVLEMPDLEAVDSREAFMAQVMPLIAELTPAAVASDGAAYLDALAEHVPGRVGVTGYCMGGRLGWSIAGAHPDRVACLGSFHTGGLVSDAPDSPHRAAAELSCELYFGFADRDRNMTPQQIVTLERKLDEVGARYRAEVYPGALHGYTMADTPVYDEAASERHFRELFALLDRTLPA